MISATRLQVHISAARSKVYHARIDRSFSAKWKVPEGMTCHVHKYNTCEGGRICISRIVDFALYSYYYR